ncbi:Hint domain-containing protein [Harenicola maris]|uniref:Hint domain-containing protein n=1 Tax=Harenicola maris TaxID=2841044 RepID=UPI002E195069
MLVENVQQGDRILTRDSGMQTVIWVGRKDVSAADMVNRPALRPVRIARGSLGHDLPNRDMLVSPQHRLLVRGADLSLQFGESEMLVPAKALQNRDGISTAAKGVSYIHLLFARHEVILSDAIWTESFQPATRMVDAMDRNVKAELYDLFPDLEADDCLAFDAARPSLSARELHHRFEIG